MDDSFIKTVNITYDRFFFFSSKPQKVSTEVSSTGDEEITLKRDTLILNMPDFETQNELSKESVTPTKALEIAIHMGMHQLWATLCL